MIRDAAFAMSDEQSLVALPVFPATSLNGALSTNTLDLHNIGASGGRVQFIEIEITETIDINMTFGLAIWPDLGVLPADIYVISAAYRYLSQIQLFAPGDTAAGQRHYLPIDTASLDQLAESGVWRYMTMFYLGGGATTGAVTARLVDTVTHRPRRFDANNQT